jgi:hypothetical protein
MEEEGEKYLVGLSEMGIIKNAEGGFVVVQQKFLPNQKSSKRVGRKMIRNHVCIRLELLHTRFLRR